MAYENDIYTRNEDSELAVRVVTATEGTNNSSYDDVFTRDTNGKLAVRVVGAGGGDSHNLGYFATPQALSEAYPTGEEGDYAIVGSTDTVWIWDSGTSAWVDTDTKGQVESVNGQTGAVTLGINDVAPTQTGKSGYVLGTDGFVAGWVKPEIVQVSAMPVASEDEVDNIYQYVGITDANYTNGYFYKCVSDGQTPATYSWTQTNVQPSSGGQIIQYDTMPTGSAELDGKIIQYTGTTSGNYVRGQFYRYNYSNNYWHVVTVAPRYQTTLDGTVAIGEGMTVGSTGSYNVYSSETIAIGVIASGGKITRDGVAIGYQVNCSGGVAVGYRAGVLGNSYGGVAVGGSATVNSGCNSGVAIGGGATLSANSGAAIAIGCGATVSGAGAVQIGWGTNPTANTLQFKNYPLVNSDGTIPEARLADTTNAQQGDVLTLDSNGNAVWQAGGGGGGSTALSLTLAAANWSNNSITVTATGVTASNNVIVSPAPASQSAYTTAGVMCTAQAADSLTFTCTTTPSSDLTVTVLII